MRKGIVLGVVLFLVQIPLVALTLIHSDVFGGPNHDDARRVAFAPDGGVYVAGTTLSADGDSDAFIRKYDANRVLLWEQAYGLPFDPTVGFDDDFVEGLAVGSTGPPTWPECSGLACSFLPSSIPPATWCGTAPTAKTPRSRAARPSHLMAISTCLPISADRTARTRPISNRGC